MKKDILKKIKTIKLFLFDLDGVLLVNDQYDLNKFLDDIKNAAVQFKNQGSYFGIITARDEDQIILSLKNIEDIIVISSTLDKVDAVDNLIVGLNLKYDEVFYMGDDILDIPLLSKCGVKAAPLNAKREVKRITDITFKTETSENLFKELFSLINK